MPSDVEAALAQLAAGKVVAAATESYFGLLADIENPKAVEALFALKPRGADKGVPIILPERSAWPALVAGAIPSLAQAFADAHWPGGLSIALPAAPSVAARVALDGSLAVRLAGASPAADLARRFGRPLSATSANLPGAPPTTRSTQVELAFPGAVAQGVLLVLSGESPGGAPSTVVRVSEADYAVARVGAVSPSVLEEIAKSHVPRA
ncbi:MAG: L-threonylcarbamoyladenylate synthase [Pseudomonadota bacterium]